MPYKPAKLYSAKGDLSKEWYVYYYYLIPGSISQYQRIRERFNINRQKTASDRMAYGRELVKFLNEKLLQGYNPFTVVKTVGNELELKISSQLFVIKTELSKDAPSEYAVSSYMEHYNRLMKYICDREMEGYLIGQFDMKETKRFKKYLIEKKLSKKTINSTFSYVSKFWELAIEKKWTIINPFLSIPRVKKREAKNEANDWFEPLTSEEMDKVFPFLKEQQQEAFIIFLAMIFYGWARPIEITRLLVRDIEIIRQLIRFKKGETKNNESAYVQIVTPLLTLLKRMELYKYPGDYYLFSDDFKPGIRQVSKHYALKRWHHWVKEKQGINKDMYALKHTGNIDYLLKNKGNTDLKWQQSQNRHQTSAMTDRYNRKLGAYFIDCDNLNFRLFD